MARQVDVARIAAVERIKQQHEKKRKETRGLARAWRNDSKP